MYEECKNDFREIRRIEHHNISNNRIYGYMKTAKTKCWHNWTTGNANVAKSRKYDFGKHAKTILVKSEESNITTSQTIGFMDIWKLQTRNVGTTEQLEIPKMQNCETTKLWNMQNRFSWNQKNRPSQHLKHMKLWIHDNCKIDLSTKPKKRKGQNRTNTNFWKCGKRRNGCFDKTDELKTTTPHKCKVL